MTARFNTVQKRILGRLTREWQDVGKTPMVVHGLQNKGLVEQRKTDDGWQVRLTDAGVAAKEGRSS